MPGGVLIDVLPEVEHMGAELVGVGVGVKEAVAVVTRQRQVLGQRGQVRVGLSGGKGRVAVLQRDLRSQQLGVGVRLRGPLHDVLHAVAVKRGLVLPLGGGADVGIGISGEHGDGTAQQQHQNHRQRQKTGTDPFACHFPFHLMFRSPFRLFQSLSSHQNNLGPGGPAF